RNFGISQEEQGEASVFTQEFRVNFARGGIFGSAWKSKVKSLSSCTDFAWCEKEKHAVRRNYA
ncbi:hypothetical protein A2U01_0039779, partial [Trifolium medium]|nr:hypothetical protein [Trifolium medium]